MSLSERIAVYQEAKQRGIRFLLSAIDSDGRPVGAGTLPRVTYYRLPWTLAVAGETAVAHRVLNWIEMHALGADGSFHGGIEWDSSANQGTNTYAETCLVYGAHLLRRFDIARQVFNNASQFQDQVTGGIFMHREECDEHAPQLLFPTCQYGMSAVMTGHLDQALAVGEWLARLWSAQPDVPQRLYTVWTKDTGLQLHPPSGERATHYVNISQDEQQAHYNGGIAAACLVHLYFATGDEKWLNLARSYQQFSINSTEKQFQTKQVCKSAWGASLLFLATRQSSYLPWLVKMGDWFVVGQESDGGWSNTPYLDPHPSRERRLEITAEFIVHLDSLLGALATAQFR